MKICIIGTFDSKTNGLQTFNRLLVEQLKKMGHMITIIPEEAKSFLKPSPILNCETVSFPMILSTLNQYDRIILSGLTLNYSLLLSVVTKPVFIWTHGKHISPFQRWNGAGLNRPNVTYIATTGELFLEAQQRNARKAILFDMPINYEPKEVQSAGGFCIAIGTLEARKNYPHTIEISNILKKTVKVYGVNHDKNIKSIVDKSDYLKYQGTLSHDELLSRIGKADFLIHTSVIEGRPTAVLEAMGLGIPVIVPDIPLYHEFVNPNYNIFLDSTKSAQEQLDSIDLKSYRAIKNRRALAKEIHGKYGLEVFRNQLTSLLGLEQSH